MSPLGERLAWIVATLRAALGAYALRLARPLQPALVGTTVFLPLLPPEPLPRLAPALWHLFQARLGRTVARFRALHAAWAAGTLKPSRPGRPRAPRAASAPRDPAPRDTATEPPPRLPRAFAWLVLRAPEAATAAGMFNMLVEDAETRRFVAEVPRAGRLLRPLCQALGIRPPPYLRLPPRPRKPRAPRPPRPPRPSLDDPTLKWRGWEKRAARASIRKFGRG